MGQGLQESKATLDHRRGGPIGSQPFPAHGDGFRVHVYAQQAAVGSRGLQDRGGVTSITQVAVDILAGGTHSQSPEHLLHHDRSVVGQRSGVGHRFCSSAASAMREAASSI